MRRERRVLVPAVAVLLALSPMGAGTPAVAGSFECPQLPDPTWATRQATDYGVVVDDGLDDTAALQAAIDDGGTVQLPAGRIDCFDTIDMRSNVALRGVEGSVLRLHDASVRLKNVSRVALLGFEIVGDGSGARPRTLVHLIQFVEDMLLEDMTLRDAPHDAISALRECRRLCWINNVVDGAGDDGLNPGGGGPGTGTHDVLIRGNVVRNVAHDGIHVSMKSFDITVIDNVVEHCDTGVVLLGCRDSLIAGTTIANCRRGIVSGACCGYEDTPGMTIVDNTTDGAAIRVVGACAAIVDNDAPVVEAGFALAYGNESIEGHVPGDIDCDDVVGFRDLLALLESWGDTGPLDRADLDGSGSVDLDDLLRLLSGWTGG